jgi:hypothetical protein
MEQHVLVNFLANLLFYIHIIKINNVLHFLITHMHYFQATQSNLQVVNKNRDIIYIGQSAGFLGNLQNVNFVCLWVEFHPLASRLFIEPILHWYLHITCFIIQT